jgi:hypothetical protein
MHGPGATDAIDQPLGELRGLAGLGIARGWRSGRKRLGNGVVKARSELVGLDAETVVDPAADMLGTHAETFRLAVLLGLPLWLELAAPVVLAYGFAPAPRKEEPPRLRRKRRRKTTQAPKSAVPSVKATTQSPLKLVAANDR